MTTAMPKTDSEKQDFKDSVFLPKTDFALRAGLAQKEPEILAFWDRIDLYDQMKKMNKGKKPFILHDGPPYANGHIHIGHAINKILKDVVNRCFFMNGHAIDYIPGWDCHGLPIEWKIEEKYRERGQDKDTISKVEFRKECREFASHWVDVQSKEFQRLGVVGDWKKPYITMSYDAEALILDEIFKFAKSGGLYKGYRPVMWSVVEKTALADAEIEYEDHVSNTIWVKFPIVKSPDVDLTGASVVIWTTTPWTIPGNRAVAYGEEIDYGLFEVVNVADNSMAVQGERLILSVELAAQVAEKAKIEELKLLKSFKGTHLAGAQLHHPFHGTGYDFIVPALAADFVTVDAGTGLVHIAPGHGTDDFLLGRKHHIDIPQTVGPDGVYYEHVPMMAGKQVYTDKGKAGDADPFVIDELKSRSRLLARGKITHSYPHSWRSKAPLIFRTTPQWFISLEANELRQKSLDAIDETVWVPAQGRNRIYAMIENRPDWCISRQRAWGVPIALFVHKRTGDVLIDEGVFNRIKQSFLEEGADAWYSKPASYFLGAEYNEADYEQIMDIVDIWFESGCTHAMVMQNMMNLPADAKADLYLEGSDQHRGWFHSSLLESVGTRGMAPYKAVLTHGFLLDEKGYKMSKSLGNVVKPETIIAQSGADILRLWVINSDYTEDMRIGQDILKYTSDLYRRLRNTLRYLIGALAEFDLSEVVAYEEMPELEKWVLHQIYKMDRDIRQDIDNFDFHAIFIRLHNFASSDLSAFYFDIRKDSLYCDHKSDLRRKAVRTVMNELFFYLTNWLAPFLCFTAEEAYQTRKKESNPSVQEKYFQFESVHLCQFQQAPSGWHNEEIDAKWKQIRQIRRVVTGCLEVKRAEKIIGSSLQAAPILYLSDEYKTSVQAVDWDEIAITSHLQLKFGPLPSGQNLYMLEDVPNVGVEFLQSQGEKCERCWRIMDEVGTYQAYKTLCGRCVHVVSKQEACTSC